jgi:hypothetical protein
VAAVHSACVQGACVSLELKIIMSRQSRNRWIWVAVAVVGVIAFVYMSEGAMTWLRVTLHGR